MITLNKNELEALRLLWELGESKPAQIQERFAWPIDNGTLRSVLVNLVRKKHVDRTRAGKAFYYSARVPKATALRSFLQSLARIFAQGSTTELVAQLVDTSKVSADDLTLLRTAAAGGKKARKAK